MTTIFTRNLMIFIVAALLVKSAINNAVGFENNVLPASINKSIYPSIEHEKSCLGVSTSFTTNGNSFGTVNIINSDGNVYKKQTELWHIANSIPISDIISDNKIIVKVNLQNSEVIDKRIKETSDIAYIVRGTVLEEVYISQGIENIEKIKLQSREGCFYILELASNGDSRYGENFLTQLDNISRFINR